MAAWREQLKVPRTPFIPPVVWDYDAAAGGFVSVSRGDDVARWQQLVDADEPLVTQVDDGTTPPGRIGLIPTSSSSKPSLVAAMLTALDLREGQRVLEIGTGTGWNTALLSDRVGERGQVLSVEVDPALARHARLAHAEAGHAAVVVTGDGAEGLAQCAPYDRVVCTASVRAVPQAWLEQTKPGGVIVTPWGTDFGNDALLRLTVNDDGSASGRCGIGLDFMRLRHQRRTFVEPEPDELADVEITTTERTGNELFEMVTFSRASFTIGLRVPFCYVTVEDIDNDHRLVELHDVSSRSWARVTLVRGQTSWLVHQLGPRRLWDEVDAAYGWWRGAGEPNPQRYGLTIDAGEHTVWLDEPDNERRWRVQVES